MSAATMPVTAVERSGSAWHVTLQGYTEAGAAGTFLWPAGVPAGVQIVPLVVVQEPAPIGQFEITGLTLDALSSMEPQVANWIAQESVLTTDPSDGGGSAGSAQSDPGPAPGVSAPMDENALVEYVHNQLESTEKIGAVADVVEIFAAEGGTLAAVSGILGPVGTIASTIIMLWAVVDAFGTGRRLREQEGFCYGVMWQTFGLPDADKVFQPWAGDSADDLRQAFFAGVAEGREKADDPKVHNAILMDVAYYRATINGDDWSAQQNVINDLWKQTRETDLAKDWLSWPKPDDDPV